MLRLSPTAELAVYRPSTGEFRWAPTTNPTSVTSRVLGDSHSVPLPGLYDSDSKTDLAVCTDLTYGTQTSVIL